MDSGMETSAVFAAALLSENDIVFNRISTAQKGVPVYAAELQKESYVDDFPHSSYKKRDYKAIS